MQKSGIHKYLTPILMATSLIVSSLYLLRPIIDPDFFWHLKTGEWIWQYRKLPSEALFSYTPPPSLAIREYFALTEYWLSQLLYNFLYLSGGIGGIVFLRFIIVGAIVYFMIKRRHGDSILYWGLLIIFIISLLEIYPIERPQVFSFLYFAILLFLLEKVEDEVGRYTLPLLMLVWANSHGGYLIGQVTIVLYVLMEGIKFTHPSLRPMKKEGYKRLLVTGFSGIVFSLINPNTYHALEMVITMPAYHSYANIEYESTVEFFRRFNEQSIILYWFIMIFTLIGIIISLKRADITQIMLLAGTGFFSFVQVRYVPFFLIAALPVVSRCYSKEDIKKWGRALVILVVLVAILFFTWNEIPNIENIYAGGWIDKRLFPVDAAEFIIANDIRGNMYNHFDWGGYLIWRLSPERKVFADGRSLNDNIYWQSLAINMADAKEDAGIPRWKALLEAYGIRYIITTPFWVSGHAIPLVNELMKDKDWILVFSDSNSMVFVKDLPENYHIIKKCSIPKKILYR